MTLFLKQDNRGKHIKLSQWIKVSDILNVSVEGSGNNRRIRVKRKGGKPDHVYQDLQGVHLDRIKQKVDDAVQQGG